MPFLAFAARLAWVNSSAFGSESLTGRTSLQQGNQFVHDS